MRNQVILARKVSELVTAYCVAENLSREAIAEKLDYTRHQFNEQMSGRTRFWTVTFEQLYSLFYKTQPQLAEKLLVEVFDGEILVIARPKYYKDGKPESFRSDGLNMAHRIGTLCGDLQSALQDNKLDRGELKLLIKDAKGAIMYLEGFRAKLEGAL